MRRTTVPIALGFALALAACVRHVELEPAPSAETTGPRTAITGIDGVDLKVETQAWNGREDIKNWVTPVLATIHNGGESSVRLRYEDFRLISPDGRAYAALPPFAVEGSVSEPRLSPVYTPIVPGFRHHHFWVAPYYSTLYPALPLWNEPFFYDPFYYGSYYPYWSRWTTIALPTENMLRWALPEGVIRPGGNVSGYLYFERVPPEEERVVLRADLMTQGGRSLGEARIPFDVRPAN